MTRKAAGEKKPLPVRKSSAHSQSKDPDEEESDIGGSLPPRDGSLDAAGHVKGAWSAEEDANLVRLVGQMGCKKWSLIAQSMPGRIGKQVSALRGVRTRERIFIRNHHQRRVIISSLSSSATLFSPLSL